MIESIDTSARLPDSAWATSILRQLLLWQWIEEAVGDLEESRHRSWFSLALGFAADQLCDRLSIAGYDHFFSCFYVCQQTRQVRLGLVNVDCQHDYLFQKVFS